MNTVEVKRDDVIKQMYFVLAIAQKCNNPMHSRTSNKDDYMGGIIDRFINTLPESVIFEKILFPKLKGNKNIELIRDFYSYSPEEAKIAPDLLGIKVDKIEIFLDDGEEIIKDVIVGIYNNKLSKNDEYAALLGLDILEGSEKNEFASNVKVEY